MTVPEAAALTDVRAVSRDSGTTRCTDTVGVGAGVTAGGTADRTGGVGLLAVACFLEQALVEATRGPDLPDAETVAELRRIQARVRQQLHRPGRSCRDAAVARGNSSPGRSRRDSVRLIIMLLSRAEEVAAALRAGGGTDPYSTAESRAALCAQAGECQSLIEGALLYGALGLLDVLPVSPAGAGRGPAASRGN